MAEITLNAVPGQCVAFDKTDPSIRILSIFGIPCESSAPAIIRTSERLLDSSEIRCVGIEHTGNAVCAKYAIGNGLLELTTTWTLDDETGVLSRADVLTNVSGSPVTMLRWLGCITLQPSTYKIYSQASRWATENQGAWVPAHAGTLTLSGMYGRTAQGCSPYACVHDAQTGCGLALHILPVGNWQMRFTLRPGMHSISSLAIECGQADDALSFTLGKGESWRAPTVLLQEILHKDPATAAASLHRYSLTKWFPAPQKTAPVIYNTWQDQWDNLDIARLRRQLAAAKACGAEAFVIDAGWFGKGKGDWFDTVGNWVEPPDAAFKGKMNEFADEVRATGLGFGMWMEPEHFGPKAKLRSNNPDWFKGGAENARFDLENPKAYAWIEKQIRRLLDTYGVIYFKIDFNIGLGIDDGGTELHRYYKAWYGMLDALRQQYPQVWFEGCASGGMRLDLEALRHFDSHFPSDTTHPIDTLRVCEGAMLRAAPGRINRWLSLHSIGRRVPMYPNTQDESPETFVGRPTTGWHPIQWGEMADLEFATICAMPGVFGMSGDLAGMSGDAHNRIRALVDLYKEWRQFIRDSVAHMLTPVRALTDRSGWAGIQLSGATPEASLVFACRLQDIRGSWTFILKDLDPVKIYTITAFPKSLDQAPRTLSGNELMTRGLTVSLPNPGSAGVFVLRVQ